MERQDDAHTSNMSLLAFYVATNCQKKKEKKKVVQQLTVFTSVSGLHTKI